MSESGFPGSPWDELLGGGLQRPHLVEDEKPSLVEYEDPKGIFVPPVDSTVLAVTGRPAPVRPQCPLDDKCPLRKGDRL